MARATGRVATSTRRIASTLLLPGLVITRWRKRAQCCETSSLRTTARPRLSGFGRKEVRRMGNVQFHSESSSVRFGGIATDYLRIHKFLDQSKLYLADWRHRALLHTTFGVALCEQFFGDLYRRESDGATVATRTIAEVHILEDMRVILTPADFLRGVA